MAVRSDAYVPAAEALGVTVDEVLARLESLRERGGLRRVAAILYHRRAGFSANGMGVWAVPDGEILQLGREMAAFRGISHCYQRPTYPDWPYSVFTMAHGRSKEECDAVLDAIADSTGIGERATLYSSTEFKKVRMMYFTDDFKRWEEEHSADHPRSDGHGDRQERPASELRWSPVSSASSLSDTRSAELYRRALHVLPGAVNSPVRAMRAIGRDPIFIERASGAEITDVDGNVYVDYVCSWGPLIHGHAHPAILEAVAEAAALGTTFGAPTAAEVELAESVTARMPSVDMLRMTSSGTEASMSAIRLARAATGRDTLLKFAGAYHGHVDGLLAEAGSGLATQGIPASPGVPAAAAAQTIVVPWNDADAVRAAFAEHELAAVLAEPYPANMGLIPPAPGFLELLRDLCTGYDTLLIFDEVITGFRVSPGGAQELTGVLPDLTVMGKILGGGLPAAAFGGPVALMERIAPAGDVYQAGTLSGNPLAVAAGRVTLALLDEQAYLDLSDTTRALADGLREAAGDRPVSVTSTTGLVTVFFAAEPPVDYAGAMACDTEGYGAWCRALLARGVYPPASQFEAWFPSTAHTPEHLARTIEAAAAAFAEVA